MKFLFLLTSTRIYYVREKFWYKDDNGKDYIGNNLDYLFIILIIIQNKLIRKDTFELNFPFF